MQARREPSTALGNVLAIGMAENHCCNCYSAIVILQVAWPAEETTSHCDVLSAHLGERQEGVGHIQYFTVTATFLACSCNQESAEFH